MSPRSYLVSGVLAFAASVLAAPAPATETIYSTVASQASTTSVPYTPLPTDVAVTNVTSHGPYTGVPTTTGALSLSVLAPSIPALPPQPFTYPSDGQLHNPEPAPFTPAGGLGTNGTAPVYKPMSDFDYESLALALYQEWIELDLFHYGLAQFSVADFEAAGLTAEDRSLIEFMADQEVGHATLLTNMLGPQAPKQCTYNYPFTNVREFIDFNQKLTRFGESGVYGFLNHLDSRASAQLLLQSITTEARQQLIFRQMDGLFPMPVWFETGIPQSWAWTLLAPYISSCPANQTRLAWQNFPALSILNNPNPGRINQTANDPTTGSNPSNTTNIPAADACLNSTIFDEDCSPAISHNKSIPLSFPGRAVYFQWGSVGETVGPNNSYVTSSTAAAPAFALWVSQLNATYTPLMNISGNTAYTFQPNMSTFAGDPAVNGSMFIAITDSDLYVTPFNITMVLPHMWAGPAIYQSG